MLDSAPSKSKRGNLIAASTRMVQRRKCILEYQLEQFHKGDGKIRDSAQKGRNSRERRSRREVLSIVLLSHYSQTTKQTFFSAEPNRRVVSDDDGVGSRIFFKDWRSLEQNQQIEVNDNTRANAER